MIRSARFLFAWIAIAAIPASLLAQIDILTNRYDQQRTGANLRETTLAVGSVDVGQFGKLSSYPVDGAVYAQPLYVQGVSIGGTLRNVLYVATMNDKLYAFDADSLSATPLWSKNVAPSPATPVPIADIVPPNLNIVGNVGIQGTPVIDRSTSTMYFVARTKENGAYVQRFHAIDIATGKPRAGSPVTIAGAVDGNAPDATTSGGVKVITFDPKVHVQRAGLALTNGVVIVAWAAHEDVAPSHGWIMAYDATTLARVGIFAVDRDAYWGGIWQGGRAPTIDAAGNVYIATGNGKWDGTRNFGDSLLKFAVSRAGLTLLDYFTPSNEAQLDLDDNDLSGSGFTLLPGTNLLIGGGKEGVLYMLDATRLGHKTAADSQVVQKIVVNGGHVMGGPVFWNSASAGPLVYNWSENDVLTAYALTGGKLSTTPFAGGAVLSPGHPGGSLTVSANGSLQHSGIIWASMPTSRDGMHGLVAGILRAFDAETLREIWNSDQNAVRDRVGTLMKFVPPVVVNGKVYLPNHDGGVLVYGLLTPPKPPDFTLAISPASRAIAPGASATFTVSVGAQNGFSARVDFATGGAPPGTSVTFAPLSVTGGGTTTMTVAVPSTAAAQTIRLTATGASGTLTHSASATVSVAPPPSVTGAIGIDFVGTATAMSSIERAGVVAQAQWNAATGASRTTPLALINDGGAKTTAQVTWTAAGIWSAPTADVAGDARMMKGYLDTTSASATTVTVGGLPRRPYAVYVYVDGDNRDFTRTGKYSIASGTALPVAVDATDRANATFQSTFTEAANSAGNYVTFTLAATTGFTLTATPASASSSTRRAPVNAIQIVPIGPLAVGTPIGIDFVGGAASAMGAAETAGVVAQAHWNTARGAVAATPVALVDAAGTATDVRVAWTSDHPWALPIAESAGNARLMKGYLDSTSTSATTVTVSGLPAASYDVYVYADGDNRSFGRIADYTIATPGAPASTVRLTDAAQTDFSGTFAAAANDAGNYVKIRITGSTFTLTATPIAGDSATLRAPVNAIQIVPAAP